MTDRTMQQRQNKKHRYKTLLFLIVIVILSVAVGKLCKKDQAEQSKLVAGCAENMKQLQNTLQETLKEYHVLQTQQLEMELTKPAPQDVDEEDPNIRYQLDEPCHFLLYVDNTMALETCHYRNICTENLLDDSGSVDIDNMRMAYVADSVLDKYIREYGGEDALYTVDWISGEYSDDCRELRAFEVCGENVRMEITYSYMTWVESVMIEHMDDAQQRPEEYIHYTNDSRICDDLGLHYDYDEKMYCMVINPEHAREVQYFRNVNPATDHTADEVLKVDAVGYYIADQAIDRYIRDFGGKDEIYGVRMIKRDAVSFQDGVHEIQAECGNTFLLIKYFDDSWVVTVEAQDEELDIGVASQEDINRAGQRKILKKFQLAINESLDIEPLAGLINLEEMYISVGTEQPLDLAPIGELTQLKKLDLYEVKGQTHEVSYFLGDLTELERLSIMRFKVKDLSFLHGMTRLQELWVSYVEDSDLSWLENADKLEGYLGLQGYNIRNIEVLAKAENLRSVELWEMEKEQKKRGSLDMRIFSGMRELERITIVRMEIEDLEAIAGLQNLKEITLVDTGVKDISCLASLQNLQKLRVYGGNAGQLQEQAEMYLSGVQSIYIDDKVSEQVYYYCD